MQLLHERSLLFTNKLRFLNLSYFNQAVILVRRRNKDLIAQGNYAPFYCEGEGQAGGSFFKERLKHLASIITLVYHVFFTFHV